MKIGFLKKSLSQSCAFQSHLFTYNLTFFTTQLPRINFNTIFDNQGARPSKTIKGRGRGCGKGKTSGRGHKGKQHGYRPPIHIQGGQTPLQRRLPKINYITKGPLYSEVNIDKLLYLIDKERIDPTKPITVRDIGLANGFSKFKSGIKLLGRGSELLKNYPPLNIVVNTACKTAIDAVQQNGGTLTCEYKSKLGLKFMMKPYRFIKAIRDPTLNFRKVRTYLDLEKKGAKVQFVKPRWLAEKYETLKIRLENLKKKLDEQPNRHLLPEYPIKIYKGMGDNKIRVKSPPRAKKIVLDVKQKH